jgi:hypothetical protein
MNGKREKVVSVINGNEQDFPLIIGHKSRSKERDGNRQKSISLMLGLKRICPTNAASHEVIKQVKPPLLLQRAV